MRIGDRSSNTVGLEFLPGANGHPKFMLAEETGITPFNSGPEPEHARPIRDEQKAQMMVAPDVRAAGLRADAGTVSPEPGDTVTDDSGRTGQLLDVYEMAAYRSSDPFAPHADIRWEDGTVEQEVNLDSAHLTFARRAVAFTEGESVYLVDPDFPTEYMGQGKFYGYTPDGKAIIVRTDVPGSREEHWHPDAVRPYLDRLPGMGIWSGRRTAITDQDGVELGEGDTVATTGGSGEILEIRGDYLVVSIGNDINTRVPAAETMLVKKYQGPNASRMAWYGQSQEPGAAVPSFPGAEDLGRRRDDHSDVQMDGTQSGTRCAARDAHGQELAVGDSVTSAQGMIFDPQGEVIELVADDPALEGQNVLVDWGGGQRAYEYSEHLVKIATAKTASVSLTVSLPDGSKQTLTGQVFSEVFDEAERLGAVSAVSSIGEHFVRVPGEGLVSLSHRRTGAFSPGDRVTIDAPGHRNNGATATVTMTPDEALDRFRAGASWPTIPYAWSGGQYIATLDKAGSGTLSDRVALSESEMRLAGRSAARKRTAASSDGTLLAAMFTSKHVGRIRPRLSRRQEEVMGMISRAEGSLPLEIGQKYRNMLVMGMDPDAVATDLQANLAIYRRIPDA